MVRKTSLGLLLGVGLFLAAGSARGQITYYKELMAGYVGTPSAPTQFPAAGAFKVADYVNVGIRIEDTSGADGIGSVEIWTRSCPDCGWYVENTCTNPPDRAVSSTRCSFSLASDWDVWINVAAYTSGTYRAVCIYSVKIPG